MSKESMQYAYHCETGEDIHISHYSVIVGKNEKLFCYCCNEPIIAKSLKSTKQISHFAHKASNIEEKDKLYKSYLETRIHKLSKEIISQQNKFHFKINDNIVTREINSIVPKEIIEKNKNLFSFIINCANGETEKKRLDIIPDIILTDFNGNEFFIEIKVTHRVYEDKRNKIINQDASCVEIDLSSINRDLDKTELQKLLKDLSLHSTINISKNIYNQYIPKIIQQIENDLAQYNKDIISKKESFIRLGLSSNENGELVTPHKKKEAFCLDCGGKLKTFNSKNYSHIDTLSNNCLLFSNTENNEEKYFLYLSYIKIQHHYLNQGFIVIRGQKYEIVNITLDESERQMKLIFDIKSFNLNYHFNFYIKTKNYYHNNADIYVVAYDFEALNTSNFDILKENIRTSDELSKKIEDTKKRQRIYIGSQRNLVIYRPFIEKLKQLNINVSINECVFCEQHTYHNKNCYFMQSDEDLKKILVEKLKYTHKLIKIFEGIKNKEIDLVTAIKNNFEFNRQNQTEILKNEYIKNLEQYTIKRFSLSIDREYLAFTINLKNGESKVIIINNDFRINSPTYDKPNFVIETVGYSLKECLNQDFINENLKTLQI